MSFFVKTIVKKVLFNNFAASLCMKPCLKIHSFLYSIISRYAILLENGIHPKHRIMQYKEWFLNHIEPGWVVLDIGCEKGRMAEMLIQKANKVYGIDINSDAIEFAKMNVNNKNIKFICGDATQFDYSDIEAIDCIILSNVLEHIENRVEFLQKLIKRVKWREFPRFLIRVPMINRDWLTLYKKELGLDYRLDKTHYIEYTFEEFQDELKKAGLSIGKYEIKFGEIYCVAGKEGGREVEG